MRKWTIDPAPDFRGFTTLRPDDGTEHGDTESQPVATVYDPDDALAIVRAVNNVERLREALEGMLSWLTSYPGEGALPAYDRAREALAALDGDES